MSSLPVAAAPRLAPTPPAFVLPDGACDAHVHIMADPGEFPLYERAVERPAAGKLADWLSRFEIHLSTLGV